MTDAARRERGRVGGGRSAERDWINTSISEGERERHQPDREERRIEDSRLHRSSHTDWGGERRGWETVGEGEDNRRPLCRSSRRYTEVKLKETDAEPEQEEPAWLCDFKEKKLMKEIAWWFISGRGLNEKDCEWVRKRRRRIVCRSLNINVTLIWTWRIFLAKTWSLFFFFNSRTWCFFLQQHTWQELHSGGKRQKTL